MRLRVFSQEVHNNTICYCKDILLYIFTADISEADFMNIQFR